MNRLFGLRRTATGSEKYRHVAGRTSTHPSTPSDTSHSERDSRFDSLTENTPKSAFPWWYADPSTKPKSKKGPYTKSQLLNLRRENVIGDDTLVWQQLIEGGVWMPFADMLRADAEAAQIPTRPPPPPPALDLDALLPSPSPDFDWPWLTSRIETFRGGAPVSLEGEKSAMHERLNGFRQTGQMCDLTIVASGDATFRAHRFILSATALALEPIIAAADELQENDTKGSSSSGGGGRRQGGDGIAVIRAEGSLSDGRMGRGSSGDRALASERLLLKSVPRAVVAALLDFVYAGHADVDESDLVPLLRLCVRLGVGALQDAAMGALKERIASRNALLCWQVGEKLALPALVDVSREAAAAQFDVIASSVALLDATASQLEALFAHEGLVVGNSDVGGYTPEEGLFLTFKLWCDQRRPKPSEGMIHSIMRHVRVSCIKRGFFESQVRPWAPMTSKAGMSLLIDSLMPALEGKPAPAARRIGQPLELLGSKPSASSSADSTGSEEGAEAEKPAPAPAE